MSRPKGSLNKKTLAKLGLPNNATIIDIEPSLALVQPAMSVEDIEAETEYNATLNQQDDTLDTFLIEIEAEFASVSNEDIEPEISKAIDFSLLNLMSQVHSEICGIINATRHAWSSDGKQDYIREDASMDYAKLMPAI